MNSALNPGKQFRVIVRRNPNASKVLFYLTSYASPWWIYALPIARFRKMGYEVVVYDFSNEIIRNDDPQILPDFIQTLNQDISSREKEYSRNGIKIFHGIGNSLGSYLIFNYALHYPLDAVVLNGGGSIADVIFNHKNRSWKEVADVYIAKGFDRQKLKKLWAHIDAPILGKDTRAEKILIMYSLKDGTIPLASSEGFVAGLKSSGKPVQTKTDKLPHIFSVINNSVKVKQLYKFLNN